MKYYKEPTLRELRELEIFYEFIEENTMLDIKLADAVGNSFSEDLSSGLARIRRKLSQHKEVWEQK